MTIKELYERITKEDISAFWLRVRETAIFTSLSTAIITGVTLAYQLIVEAGSLDIVTSAEFGKKILYTVVVSFLASFLMGVNRIRRHVEAREEVKEDKIERAEIRKELENETDLPKTRPTDTATFKG